MKTVMANSFCLNVKIVFEFCNLRTFHVLYSQVIKSFCLIVNFNCHSLQQYLENFKNVRTKSNIVQHVQEGGKIFC